VSNNPALETLDCNSNLLANLDVSSPHLNRLDCYKNQLTNLNVSNNPELEFLYCYENQLTSLDVSNDNALFYLHCQKNKLTNISVSNLSALIQLYCFTNQLKNEAMDNLLDNLPTQDNPQAVIVTISTSVDEKNVCTKDQVKVANLKGWKVMGYDVAYEDVGGRFFDYEGSDPAGIQTITLDNDSNVLIYDLNGRKLVKSNKGVNIIDGKKVIIK
jgi:Leucine-rich repeat (LRR) protein